MKRIIFLLVLLPSLILTSCMDLSMNSNNFTTEEVNDFEIMKIGLNNTTTVEYYEYICSEDTNHLISSGPIDEGLVAISITDDSDSLIFSKKLTNYTSFDEQIFGKNGIWTIKIDYQKTRGNLSVKLSNQ